ncbi:MAG: LysM peptidoglycan-binding domain-containing protein [Desulfobacteraceae bacterium]
MKKNNTGVFWITLAVLFISPLLSFAGEKGENGPAFYYTIKKGDTLWDLSQRFYNSSWEWPGLWSINQQLTNPHWLYPGNKIRIYLKKTLTRTQPSRPSEKPPIIVTPEILPTLYYPEMDGISFVRQRTIPSLGRVIKGEHDQVMITENELVYIEVTGSTPMEEGQKYLVFSTEPIFYSQGVTDRENRIQGILHQIKSLVTVLENHGTYVKARIINNFRYTESKDRVMAYEKKEPLVKIHPCSKNIQGRLIRSENNNRLLGNNAIAFINLGETSNIQKGQIYNILKRHGPAGQSLNVNIKPSILGKIIVLHTEKRTSTVMVLSNRREISPHAFIGQADNISVFQSSHDM